MKLKLIVSLVILIAFNSHAQTLTSTNHIILPPDFSKMSYNEANGAVNAETDLIVGRRTKQIGTEYIANLVNQLQSGQLNNDNKVLAVYLLGELRPSDTNSIEVLIENIDLKAKRFDLKTDLQRWGPYPAVEALVKIGKPVVNPILDHLPPEASELRRQLMCNVLRQLWHQ